MLDGQKPIGIITDGTADIDHPNLCHQRLNRYLVHRCGVRNHVAGRIEMRA
jgi:hypothetical protein